MKRHPVVGPDANANCTECGYDVAYFIHKPPPISHVVALERLAEQYRRAISHLEVLEMSDGQPVAEYYKPLLVLERRYRAAAEAAREERRKW